MIGNIRKYPKVILGIFTFCCVMFVAEFFLRSFFFKKTTVEVKMPDIVSVLDNKLTFNEYKKRIDDWSNRYAYLHAMYKIDRDSKLFKSAANNSVIDDFINDTVFSKLANYLGIEVGSEEKQDVIYGENIDNNIKSSFTDKNGKFNREEYNSFLNKMQTNFNLRYSWDKHVNLILKERKNNKIKTILDNTFITNILELKRKFHDKNGKYNVKGVFLEKKSENIDYSKYQKEINDYYVKNKGYFKNEEVFKIKYFINRFEVNEEVKKYNLNILKNLIDKFTSSANPVEMSKARSEGVKPNSTDFSKSFSEDELPDCFDGNDIYPGTVAIEFPKEVGDLIKIYKIISVDKSKKYNVAILYRNVLIDEMLKKSLLDNIQKEFKNINSMDEFEEFANEKGYNLEKLDLDLKTSDIKNFENINTLKKELYKPDSNKKSHILTPILNNNGIFVGYLYEYLAKDSIKNIEEVEKIIKRKLRKKIEKGNANKEINSNVLYKKSFADFKKNDGLTSFSVDNVKLEDVDKKTKKNKALIKDLIKHSSLLDIVETRFFYSDGKIMKVKIENINSNIDKNSDSFKSFVEESKKENKKNDSYSKIFEKIYKAKKLSHAYNLL